MKTWEAAVPLAKELLNWATGVLSRHPHLPLMVAAAWVSVGAALLQFRRLVAIGLAGGLAVACGLVWVGYWWLEVSEAATETVSARLLGLSLELIAMFWLSVVVAALVCAAALFGLMQLALEPFVGRRS